MRRVGSALLLLRCSLSKAGAKVLTIFETTKCFCEKIALKHVFIFVLLEIRGLKEIINLKIGRFEDLSRILSELRDLKILHQAPACLDLYREGCEISIVCVAERWLQSR